MAVEALVVVTDFSVIPGLAIETFDSASAVPPPVVMVLLLPAMLMVPPPEPVIPMPEVVVIVSPPPLILSNVKLVLPAISMALKEDEENVFPLPVRSARVLPLLFWKEIPFPPVRERLPDNETVPPVLLATFTSGLVPLLSLIEPPKETLPAPPERFTAFKVGLVIDPPVAVRVPPVSTRDIPYVALLVEVKVDRAAFNVTFDAEIAAAADEDSKLGFPTGFAIVTCLVPETAPVTFNAVALVDALKPPLNVKLPCKLSAVTPATVPPVSVTGLAASKVSVPVRLSAFTAPPLVLVTGVASKPKVAPPLTSTA